MGPPKTSRRPTLTPPTAARLHRTPPAHAHGGATQPKRPPTPPHNSRLHPLQHTPTSPTHHQRCNTVSDCHSARPCPYAPIRPAGRHTQSHRALIPTCTALVSRRDRGPTLLLLPGVLATRAGYHPLRTRIRSPSSLLDPERGQGPLAQVPTWITSGLGRVLGTRRLLILIRRRSCRCLTCTRRRKSAGREWCAT